MLFFTSLAPENDEEVQARPIGADAFYERGPGAISSLFPSHRLVFCRPNHHTIGPLAFHKPHLIFIVTVFLLDGLDYWMVELLEQLLNCFLTGPIEPRRINPLAPLGLEIGVFGKKTSNLAFSNPGIVPPDEGKPLGKFPDLTMGNWKPQEGLGADLIG